MRNKNYDKVYAALTKDENIEKSFRLHGCQVFATNRRLLRVERNKIRDFDYSHISSLTYISSRNWFFIIAGALLVSVGIVLFQFLEEYVEYAIISIALGVICAIVGILIKNEFVATNVIGVNHIVPFRGKRAELDSLLRIVREKKSLTVPPIFNGSGNEDFTDIIRKLAALKNEGIITQAEFDEKKAQLLRESN